MNKQKTIFAIDTTIDAIVRQAQMIDLISRSLSEDIVRSAKEKLREAEIELRLLQDKVRNEDSM